MTSTPSHREATLRRLVGLWWKEMANQWQTACIGCGATIDFFQECIGVGRLGIAERCRWRSHRHRAGCPYAELDRLIAND